MKYKDIKIDRHHVELDIKNNDIIKVWFDYNNNNATTSFNYCYSSNCFYNFEYSSSILTQRQKQILKKQCNKFLKSIFENEIKAISKNHFVLSDDDINEINQLQQKLQKFKSNILEASR